MIPLLPLPRIVFGPGSLSAVASDLLLLGVRCPLLISDRGLEQAGIGASALHAMPRTTVAYLEVSENPSVQDVDAAYETYKAGGCDGIVALGGGSVIDTAKMVAALAGSNSASAAELLGKPELVSLKTAPLIAIPTTVGTGSESSPVAAIHVVPGGAVVGTRSPRLVPKAAICDPELVRTLPPRLIAATGIDALCHCLEGYFAEPSNPVIDALALDGLTRAYRSLYLAMTGGDEARASLMGAAFMGGAAIHKGLGPVHAIALSCGDQGLHHGSLVAAALPLTLELVTTHLPHKAARVSDAGYVSGQLSAAGIKHFFTMNEIRTFVELSYGAGTHAPGLQVGHKRLAQLNHYALLGHGLSVQAIRAQAVPGTRIGVAENHIAPVPVTPSAAAVAAARIAMREENASYLTAILEGHYIDRYLARLGADAPRFTVEEMHTIAAPLDVLGLNLYTSAYVRANHSPATYEVLALPLDFPHMASSWLTVSPECLHWGPRLVNECWKPRPSTSRRMAALPMTSSAQAASASIQGASCTCVTASRNSPRALL
jgi:4-hydroxybutyrate dehydrogenase